MILEKQKESVVLQEGEQTQESIGMSLDLDSAQVLMQMLSKNLYSDAIGSTIRECASNALDSHRRAGVKDPIVVSFKTTSSDTYEFSVEDFGIGLDADDVKNIISKYGKSTKRNSANELGMMGLGFKAPLAYTSTFYFVTRKNGVERKYMMYEGEDVNTIDLLYEKPTTERNGVKVIVPVKYYDRHNFISKIKEQLAYFEDVYFNVEGINNDFFIMKTEHFQFSELATSSVLHMCLDNVNYPLDFQKLEINRINIPIALRFGLSDGIFPTPNREAIRYTQEAKEAIKKKITDVANYFVDKYNESMTETDDAMAVLNFYGNDDRSVHFGTQSWDISCFKIYATKAFKTPKLKGVENLDFERLWKHKDNLFGEYKRKYHMNNGRMYSEDTRYNDLNWWQVKDAKKQVYVYSETISGLKKDYLRHIHKSPQSVYIVKKEECFRLGKVKYAGNGNFLNYINLLQLHKKPKVDWRPLIIEFQKVLASVTSKFINLDELEVPQSFIDERKRSKSVAVKKAIVTKGRRVKLAGEVIGKELVALERFVSGKNSKLVPITINLATAHKEPKLTIYGDVSHSELMDTWFPVFPSRVRFVVFSSRELKTLKDVKIRNWISMDEFTKGEHIVFRRAATAYLISLLIKNNEYTFIHTDGISKISKTLSEKIVELKKYKNNYHLSGDKDLYTAIIEVAQKKNLFDMSIYHTYLQIKDFLDNNRYVEKMLYHSSSRYTLPEDIVDMLCDLMKYHKQRVDWKNYNIKLNEETLEVPTDEAVQDLVTL